MRAGVLPETLGYSASPLCTCAEASMDLPQVAFVFRGPHHEEVEHTAVHLRCKESAPRQGLHVYLGILLTVELHLSVSL